jgi:hypothetical protein
MLKLSRVLPEFAIELANGLASTGHHDLALAVTDIEIVQRCPCREVGCLTFYAVAKSEAPPPDDCQRVIPPVRGVSCLQHQNNRIIWIEAIDRPKERSTLDEMMPIPDAG